MKKPRIFELIKQYRWKSTFVRYFSSLFLLILIVFIPYNFFVYTYFNVLLEQEIASKSSIIALKSKDIFDILTADHFINFNLISSTESVGDFLTSDEKSQAACLDLITSMDNNSETDDEIFLYSIKNKTCLSSNFPAPISTPSGYNWINTYAATKKSFIMFPRKVDSEEFNFIYLCSEVYNSSNKPVGVFCTKFDYAAFTDIIYKSFEEKPDRIFIVSDIELILYSDESKYINTLMFANDDVNKDFVAAKNAEDNTIFVGDSIVSIAESENSKLRLMSYTNRASFSRKFSKIYTMVIIGGIAVFLSSIILALFISFKLYRSVILVMDTLEDPDKLKGHTKLLNEFFYISNTIADRTRENSNINSELDEKIMALKKSQIAALQAQINPHFLFNTLQLINLNILKETKADTEATKLISLLSDLLHSSYDTQNYLIPVKEEIDSTTKYLEIQKARYKMRLRVTYDVSEECLQYQTIKLILQPFVENSILHGFKEKESDWLIKIRCYLQNDYIVYEISDNGGGIPYEILKEINLSIQQKMPGNKQGIGVYNVNQRISLVFGNQCDFKITSKPNEGTVVVIRHKAFLSL